ncbi:hypothetical protein GIY56_17530 [Paracoccus sp. YIM 132242]|uniref:Uncharacterized protein n=1 Tax=Paracoccus lichenicola TaxID=2665644 RepID=A0A6L6HSD2_9RHOB|nr:hypothetical protein [Paracoccus lichenicola]MTE02094.1 hypothetical protein [Paracoccus lichenicola]
MATPSHTPRPFYVEAPSSSNYSFPTRFVGLLNVLAHHIRCEEALFQSDPSDPCHDRFSSDAAEARVSLDRVLDRVAAVQDVAGTDVPLYRMALIIRDLVRNGTAPVFRRQAEESMALDLVVPGEDAAEVRVRKMLLAARKRLLMMADIPLYQSARTRTDTAAAADVPAPQAA